MRLRATAILGSSSIVSIGVGILSAKAWALLVGPAGVGQLGLLQALVAALTILAGLGAATAVVRRIAAAHEAGDESAVAGSADAATVLVVIGGSATAVVLVIAREPLAALILGDAQQAAAIVLAGVALIAGLLASIQLAVLNGLGRIRPLALAAAIASVAGAAASIAILFALGLPGVKVAVPAAALAGLVVAITVRRLAVPGPHPAATRRDTLSSIRSMLAFGGPFTVSLLISSGVQLALPVIVLGRLGALDVGYYRAATTISMAYLGFLLSTLSQDYYPRLAAIAGQPEAVATAVRDQLRMLLALATPVIFVAVGVASIMVPVLYSSEFSPAAALLRWQLSADVLRLPSWCFAFVLLAQGRTRAYFLTELVAGASLIAFVTLGVELFGLEGAGIGSIAAYLIYYPLVAAVATRGLPSGALVPVQPIVYGCLATAIAIAIVPRLGLGSIQPVLGVTAGLIAAALSVRAIRPALRAARSGGEASDGR